MTDDPKGDDHADGDAGGQVLPKVKGEEGQGISSSDLSIFNRAELENRQAAEVKATPWVKAKHKPSLHRARKARKDPKHQKRLRDLNAVDLSVLAPRQVAKGQASVNENFLNALYERMMLYRQDALDALRDLAMMPISENSMQNNVKYLAASKLLGNQTNDVSIAPVGNGVRSSLEELNLAYQEQSKRITQVRERVITFEDDVKIVN